MKIIINGYKQINDKFAIEENVFSLIVLIRFFLPTKLCLEFSKKKCINPMLMKSFFMGCKKRYTKIIIKLGNSRNLRLGYFEQDKTMFFCFFFIHSGFLNLLRSIQLIFLDWNTVKILIFKPWFHFSAIFLNWNTLKFLIFKPRFQIYAFFCCWRKEKKTSNQNFSNKKQATIATRDLFLFVFHFPISKRTKILIKNVLGLGWDAVLNTF